MLVRTYNARSQEPAIPQRPQSPPRPTMPVPMIFERAETPRARWEYRVVVVDPREQDPVDEAQLAELGAEGWLLAAVLEGASGRPGTRLYYYFVRAA